MVADSLSSIGAIAIVLGLFIGVIHYFSDIISKKLPDIQELKLMSFGAGISIAFIFLALLPELFEVVEHFRLLSFLFVLVGFSLIHLFEKHIYKIPVRRLEKELEEAHSAAFFIYYLVIGIVLVNIISVSLIEGILFFIPITFHAGISSISMKKIHKKVKETFWAKLLLSASTIIGVILMFYAELPSAIYHSLLGFIIGALLYISIRDMIPEKRKGEPTYFVFGVVLFSILVLALFLL